MGVPAWGQVIAVAAAVQESSLTNLPGGDRDSVGLVPAAPQPGLGHTRCAPRPGLRRQPVLPGSARRPRMAADARDRGRAAGSAQRLPVRLRAVERRGHHARQRRQLRRRAPGRPRNCGADAGPRAVPGPGRRGRPDATRGAGPSRRPVRVRRDRAGRLRLLRAGRLRLAPGRLPAHRPHRRADAPDRHPRPGRAVRVRPYDTVDPRLRFGRLPASGLRPIPGGPGAANPGRPVPAHSSASARPGPARP
jgi:hypothetical protein